MTSINELKEYNIEFLFDIRSNPVSKFNFHFNQTWLAEDLPKVNITYEFSGELLGGLPRDKTCYVNGRVDYSKIRQRSFFQAGIKQIMNKSKIGFRIALMCSEANPEECHRSKLIGQELLKYGISIKHITSEGIKNQERVIAELTKGKGATNLFGENDFTSRKTYI